MPFTPDAPYPKTPGNPIMAKDWNDAIGEVQRLDSAKVNRSGLDTIQGPLTITNALTLGSSLAVGTTAAVGSTLSVTGGTMIGGALAVGSTQAASNRLHVVDTANPAVARVQTTATNGSSRLELWSDPRGSGTEWRPGYVESFDTGTFTGGLRFFTNGTGQANRQGSVEAFRVVNGLSGFGVTNPAFRIDALGPIRSRNNGGVNSGLWLNQPTGDRAFFGMLSDTVTGIQGNAGAGWALQMDVTNGNLGLRTAPTANALTVQGDTQHNGNAWVSGVTALGHSAPGPGLRLDVLGRMRLREQAGTGTAGLWFYQATPAADRAFIGMNGDNLLGLWGSGGASWGVNMDVNTAAVSCAGNLTASRVWSSNVHGEVRASNQVTTTLGTWQNIPDMAMTFFLASARYCWIWLHLPNVRATAGGGTVTLNFQLVLDGTYVAGVTPYFLTSQFTSTEINLTRIMPIAAGSHVLQAQWGIGQNGTTIYICEQGVGAFGDRSLQVIEF